MIGDSSPLHGLRVLEIGHFVAAPFATRLMADLGADVIKIEPLTGDPVRQWGDQIDGKSLWWSLHGRNKRSVACNLKDPRVRDLILRLVRECDAVVENFRPGQLVKLGLGPDVLRRERPDLIIAHISGYGQTGPYRDRAAFGVIGEAIGGLRHLTDQPPGVSDLPPVRVGVSIGDSLAGLYAAFGLVSALWQRDRSGGDGRPRTIDIALTESVLSLMEGMLPEYGKLGKIRQPTGGGIATAAPTNAYPSADGGFVLIAANSEPLFAKLMHLIGRADLVGVPRFTGNQKRVEHSGELDQLIANWSRQHDRETLIGLLNEADIPSSLVYTAADIAADPQYRDRGMVIDVHDEQFDGSILHPGVVPRCGAEPAAIRWAGPAIGAHTDEVLQGLLAMSGEEISELRVQGAIS
ncbi:CaiB/BaiF CoA transferase family protein [Sphingomonas sp. SRS2]|uniref:CaiB/BaiF CoA transferase family protein n=1 Tax=Sphingomonas sp. SRS2 TaxID=133190 RepID=UPI0006184F1A|nr:CoA transferase [Sphingomonas sp. SRS2]KKC26644.1 carnitine dehydratase [Sphingomonas sp. SRS2]